MITFTAILWVLTVSLIVINGNKDDDVAEAGAVLGIIGGLVVGGAFFWDKAGHAPVLWPVMKSFLIANPGPVATFQANIKRSLIQAGLELVVWLWYSGVLALCVQVLFGFYLLVAEGGGDELELGGIFRFLVQLLGFVASVLGIISFFL